MAKDVMGLTMVRRSYRKKSYWEDTSVKLHSMKENRAFVANILNYWRNYWRSNKRIPDSEIFTFASYATYPIKKHFNISSNFRSTVIQ